MGILTALKRAASSVPTPSTGKVSLFNDTADGLWKSRDETGAVTPLAGVVSSRTLTAGAGLTGGGDLSANRTFDVVAADGSITVTADAIGVGTINDAQHGSRSGGALHALVTQTGAGFQSPTDKARSDNLFLYQVNVADYGADMTGTNASDTALTNATAGGGKVVLIPPGVLRLTGAPYVVSDNNVALQGAGPNSTTIKTTATTGDQLRLTGYGCTLSMVNVQGPGSGTTSSKTSGLGVDMQSVEGRVSDCAFSYQYDSLAVNGTLVDVDNVFCRYFAHSGIVVTQNSDHRISRVTMNNASATLPTGSGIDVQVTASLILDRLNIINSNFALNVSPATGVTVPSLKATNCFFDTSAVGVRFAGAGSVFRSEFTNCWMSSMTSAGVYVGPTAGTVDGVTFVNCSVYNNVAGTTNGVIFATGNYGSVDFANCRVAGWTNGINVAAGSTTAYPTIKDCHIGAQSAFGNNTTGITIAAVTVAGLIVDGCKVSAAGNGTMLALGTVTSAVWSQFRITDNPGINPRGAVTTPAVAASAAVVTNTTGFRVTAYIKGGVTSVVTVNGVATPSVLAAGGNLPVQVDPGGTIAVTYTTAFTWVWAAN